MDENSLYYQIYESVRQDILKGVLKAGDKLMPVREMSVRWDCTPGTVQRAYHELSEQGLVTSRSGKGTIVSGEPSAVHVQKDESLKKAMLVNRAETFLLELISSGYDLVNIQEAVNMAMDRWRTIQIVETKTTPEIVRFVGSHDMVVNAVVSDFQVISNGSLLQVEFSGSLGGLIALAEGKADIAGSHLWDSDADSYNLTYIKRILPSRKVRVYCLAYRKIGFILSPGNPYRVMNLEDLTNPKITFINRQSGSGTRVWLDAQLEKKKIDPGAINGYQEEKLTHSDVARCVAENSVDVGVGLESAAKAYGLDFVPLTKERYDLIILQDSIIKPGVQKLIEWLSTRECKELVSRYRGYDASDTGKRIL